MTALRFLDAHQTVIIMEFVKRMELANVIQDGKEMIVQ